MRRLYVMFFLLIFMSMFLPQITSAHTSLQSSLPEANATVENELKEIILDFNTEIEPLSSFKLKNENDNEILLGNKEIKDNRIVGTFDDPIPNGSYTLEWKIVGRDGHPIQGDFSFTVDIVASQNTASESSQEPTIVPEEPNPSPQSETLQESEIIDNPIEQDRGQIGFWIAGAVILVAFFVIGFGARRKK